MAELISYTDSLRQGADKINDSILLSDQAMVTADSAVVVATNLGNEAKGISNNALNIAGQAKQTAESIQEQFNQVVIDGDSSVEAAQARVNADGTITYATLKERLDTEYIETKALIPEREVEKTIYVDVNNGNDVSGDGGIGNPYATITKAISTVNKTLFAGVKIRVLPGDYTDENTIWVENFSKKYLTITAFDGTKEVAAPNDDYIVNSFNVDSNDKIMIQGFKINWDGDSGYGIFTSNTRFAYYIGIKNNLSTHNNNGFGVTVNSEVYLENCLVANKDTVVSCNFGSRVVSKDWHTSSTNNRVGLWAHGGSLIFKDGVQPGFTQYAEFIDSSGKIIEESGRNRSQQLLHTIAASSVVTDTIINVPLTLPIAPSWIKIDAILQGTPLKSNGAYSINSGTMTQSAVLNYANGNQIAGYEIVQLNDGAGNSIKLKIDSVYHNNIALKPTVVGTLTGNIQLVILCGC